MPVNPIVLIVLEIVDVQGTDFMRTFPSSFGNKYILLAVNYASKWVKVVLTRTTKARIVAKFLKKKIFSQYGMPKAIISDQDIHFDNRFFDALLKKYS